MIQSLSNPLPSGLQRRHLKPFVLYLLLAAGGLWHALDVLQQPMRVLASPMLIALALWLAWEYMSMVGGEAGVGRRTRSRSAKRRFTVWAITVVLGGFGAEVLGVHTGAPFGDYSYGGTLAPSIGGVPIAIGFAWLGMLIASFGVSDRLLQRIRLSRALWKALLVAALMVAFDLLMEPAAIRLDYWRWQDGMVPLRNYLAWFGVSFLFAYSGLRLGLFRRPMPLLAFHAYVAQLIYFALVLWG